MLKYCNNSLSIKTVILPDFDFLVKVAKRANMAYFNQDEINKLWENKDSIFINAIEKPIYITKNEASAYFWIENTNDDKCANIIFRGTNSIQDVIDDLDTCLISVESKDGKVKVHEGFYRQFMSIEPQITKLIQDGNITSVHIFAHSLGAGIGQIAAAFYGEKNIEISIYTIGCPRTGNDKFVKWFTKKVQKIDPETHNILETFECIQDVCNQYRICHKTIKKVSESGDIYKKFIWKII